MKKLLLFLSLILLLGCTQNNSTIGVNRLDSLPERAVKMTNETDSYPPILHSSDYYEPVALPYPVNTVGAEDSPFIPYNSDELYFFFTPNASIPVNEQLFDQVTGIYVTKHVNDSWAIPERLWLNIKDILSMDGCQFIEGEIMYFCSAREGYTGVNWFTAKLQNNSWTNVKLAGFNSSYEVGELHIYEDELFFHSSKSGGLGGYDLWMSRLVNDEWSEPVNLAIVNSPSDEGWPYISSNGLELWFLRTYMGSPAIYKSVRAVNSSWQAPELIVSNFAGEPALDKDGNLYFVHHFFKNGELIEADIYVAYKK